MKCVFGFIAAVFVMTGSSFANERTDHTVGGRTAREAFSDPKLAALANAACTGDDMAIAQTLHDGADPNGRARLGDTPLFWAVDCANLTGIEALLKAGADPNYKAPHYFSATWVAARMSNPAPLKLLLKYGGDPNATSESGETALWMALSLGVDGHGWENYYALLNAGANINRANSVGRTIATEASALGSFDKVEELLNRGYDYDLVMLGGFVQNRQIDSSASPEMAAAKARVIEILKSRGVHFPVPAALTLYSGRARMDESKDLIIVWYGGTSKKGGTEIKAYQQVIKPGQPGYEAILRRVGGLKPGYGKGVPRRSEDPIPFSPAN
jgi:hypothetical protein